MRILIGYNYFPHPVDVRSRVESRLERLRGYGFHVDGIPLNPAPPEPALYWPELEARWRRGDKSLLRLYENLARRLESYDVFLNINGINLYPEMVKQLPAITAYACFDDPESSAILSKPVAPAYDVALVGNIACLDSYREWGVQRVHWWPIGFQSYDYDPSLTREKILSGQRDISVALLCGLTSWRSDRVCSFVEAFPEGAYYGCGWPAGLLSEEQRVALYQRTRIGPNFHNSVGPVNSRTFVLPANGVMQICDNRNLLGNIFEIGKEVVGFDNVKEAIDLCRYYLSHDSERREIAAAGWERVTRDYSEQAVFSRFVSIVEPLLNSVEHPHNSLEVREICRKQRCRTAWSRLSYNIVHSSADYLRKSWRLALNKLKHLIKRHG